MRAHFSRKVLATHEGIFTSVSTHIASTACTTKLGCEVCRWKKFLQSSLSLSATFVHTCFDKKMVWVHYNTAKISKN